MSFQWVPDPKAMEDDEEDFERFIQRRYVEIVEDMKKCGFTHLLWLNTVCKFGVYDWLDARDCQVSHLGFVGRSCYGFKNKADLLIFKLTWGGA